MQILFAAPFVFVRKSLLLCAILACVLLANPVRALQDEPRPLKPDDPRLDFSFSVAPGAKPFRFHVNLDATGRIRGVAIYRSGESVPFQTLSSCSDFPDVVNTAWIDAEIARLIDHQDFNFDGFDDLELAQNYVPHLDKWIYCIYLWDSESSQFRLSKELSDVDANLEAHPENKTLTGREDWQGGIWQNSTYRWKSGHPELIEQSGLYGGWGTEDSIGQPCGFQFSCSRRIRDKMVVTLHKWVCSPKEMNNLPVCPAAPKKIAPQTSTPAPNAR